MTCVDSVCTALSSASRKVTAMTLPRRACALLSFSREPTPACCVQNSLRSCLLVRPEIPLSGPPLIVCRVRLTVAARRKNSSPENLTHLHYNLLGKDSSVRCGPPKNTNEQWVRERGRRPASPVRGSVDRRATDPSRARSAATPGNRTAVSYPGSTIGKPDPFRRAQCRPKRSRNRRHNVPWPSPLPGGPALRLR